MQLKQLLAKYNLTQRAFADITGIPLRTVENWCRGFRELKPYIYNLIEFYLSVKLGGNPDK